MKSKELKQETGNCANPNLPLHRAPSPFRAAGSSDYAMIPLHCLRIYIDTPYRMTIDLLTDMSQICREIGRLRRRDLIQFLRGDFDVLAKMYLKFLVEAVDDKIKQVLSFHLAVCLS
jgi:hypothetical protein